MSDASFTKPQRQSVIGILLIFSTALFHLLRNFWVLGVYLFVGEISQKILLWSLVGFFVVIILTLIYSIFSFLRFRFYIDEEKREFILEKGVFSSEVVSIPFHKIQQVNFKRNLLQRLLGVYSVAIDTAGSKDKEVEIKALSKLQAESLGETLMEFAAKETSTTEVPEDDGTVAAEEAGVLWQHRLNLSTLLKLGLTSNYLRGLAILLTFYFSLQEQFQYTGEEVLVPDFRFWEMLSSGILIFLLVLLGMIITLGETFIKYYKLSLKRGPAGLQVEMGLRENTRVTLRAQRVQLFQILTNPIQRRLDLHKIRISLASSQDDLTKDKIIVPGLPMSVVNKVKEYFYGDWDSSTRSIRPNRLLLMRRILGGCVPLILGGIAYAFSSYDISLEGIVLASTLYLFLLITFQVLYVRTIKLEVSENFLIVHSGVWIRKLQIIEMYKLQAVSYSQPLWYKRRGLVNVVFHTAGGDLKFNLVSRMEAVELMNFLLYKIEVTQKKWM